MITPTDVKIGTGGVKGIWLINVSLENANNSYKPKKEKGLITVFFYASKACTITGSKFKNFTLRQGWNTVAEIYAENVTNTSQVHYLTTQIPAGFYWITEPK